jgi:L-serine dehydratase
MGPRRAAEMFRARHPDATAIRCSLFGSLAATGKGHLTDVAIVSAFAPLPVSIEWHATEFLPKHPNGMQFVAADDSGRILGEWRVYSIGGGALLDEDGMGSPEHIYPITKMEGILAWADARKAPLWAYVEESESPGIWDHLAVVWRIMNAAIDRGLVTEGRLPGMLELKRKSKRHFDGAHNRPASMRTTGLLTAYALAVSEENAGGGVIVTAPTCGACGVLPGVLRYLQEANGFEERDILRALATAGLIGNLVKKNASISGAAVGCQGEVGTACAMAAGAAAFLMGGSNMQVEYAAEMGFEHHLGLTCDPIAGLVQIPCIERNAVGATRAVSCAEYAMLTDGEHEVPFDSVVETMKQTGKDMLQGYRETSTSGLAVVVQPRAKPNQCS